MKLTETYNMIISQAKSWLKLNFRNCQGCYLLTAVVVLSLLMVKSGGAHALTPIPITPPTTSPTSITLIPVTTAPVPITLIPISTAPVPITLIPISTTPIPITLIPISTAPVITQFLPITSIPLTPIPITPIITKPLTITPTPSLVPNRSPVITTKILPLGRVKRNYVAYIKGYDADITDNLDMKITNLPHDIHPGPCAQYVAKDRKVINCVVSGTPRKGGVFFVFVTLTDNQGGVAKRFLPLVILPR